jgi:hypothetical protein
MQKISVKYVIKNDNYESDCIIYTNGQIEISPYNYTEKDIFTCKISRKKIQNFIKHLNEILSVKK